MVVVVPIDWDVVEDSSFCQHHDSLMVMHEEAPAG